MAKAQYVQVGDIIDFIPDEDVLAGDIVIIGELVGVTKRAIDAGTSGGLSLTGVYDIVKDANAGVTFSVGDKAYWDDGSNVCVTAAAGTLTDPIGVVIRNSEDSDESVRVRLAG